MVWIRVMAKLRGKISVQKCYWSPRMLLCPSHIFTKYIHAQSVFTYQHRRDFCLESQYSNAGKRISQQGDMFAAWSQNRLRAQTWIPRTNGEGLGKNPAQETPGHDSSNSTNEAVKKSTQTSRLNYVCKVFDIDCDWKWLVLCTLSKDIKRKMKCL